MSKLSREEFEKLVADRYHLYELGFDEAIGFYKVDSVRRDYNLANAAYQAGMDKQRESDAVLVWCYFVDLCVKEKTHPSGRNELFAVCGKIRNNKGD